MQNLILLLIVLSFISITQSTYIPPELMTQVYAYAGGYPNQCGCRGGQFVGGNCNTGRRPQCTSMTACVCIEDYTDHYSLIERQRFGSKTKGCFHNSFKGHEKMLEIFANVIKLNLDTLKNNNDNLITQMFLIDNLKLSMLKYTTMLGAFTNITTGVTSILKLKSFMKMMNCLLETESNESIAKFKVFPNVLMNPKWVRVNLISVSNIIKEMETNILGLVQEFPKDSKTKATLDKIKTLSAYIESND